MFEIFEIFPILLFIVLATISPGPDFVIVAQNSLCYSRRVGVMTVLGLGAGMLFHVSYCILGVGIFISQSILLFNILKFVGAAYLIYLGVKSLFSKRANLLPQEILETDNSISHWRGFQRGFLTNLLNPKAVMFFVSFFTVIVKPTTPISRQIFFGSFMVVSGVLWFSLMALFLSHGKVQRQVSKAQHWVEKIAGAFLIALGAKIAFARL
ncbi:MAG: LysE family transporter [Alphaproteobacteria bacterium]|jgi:RhtB (resistance to homoserine/threonine) family protein|nr:LysE family transporter [Alphaproteobacteria bacterium]MBT5389206.1 LysE family transporter [Alphaproteobacteria bacterium]